LIGGWDHVHPRKLGSARGGEQSLSLNRYLNPNPNPNPDPNPNPNLKPIRKAADRPPFFCPISWFTSVDGGKCCGKDVIRGLKNVEALLNGGSEIRAGRTLATRDSYHWWARHERRYHAGKPIYVDREASDTFSILFDDHNAPHEVKGICQVLDRKTGLPVEADRRHRNLIHVKPLEVILDHTYFLEGLLQAEIALGLE